MARPSLGCLSISLLASLTACGADDGKPGSSCTVDRHDSGGGATIRCDDGTETTVEGAPASCTVRERSSGVKTIECADGTEVEIEDGEPGARGEPGEEGAMGEPGGKGDPGETGGPGSSAFIVGPGLNVEVSDVAISDDRYPVVALSLHDAADHPLDRTGGTTPGAVSVSFVIGYLPGPNDQYVPYNVATVDGVTVDSVAPVLSSAMQPRADSAGTWTVVDADAGTYTYRFGSPVPEGYDATRTHTVALYASRTFDGVQYAADPIFHFRPDGEEVTETREVVVTETCNNCHDTLAVHGGSRRDLGLCITCHTDGMADPESGNSIDMKQMIHKIHRGKNLPSVVAGTDYFMVGYRDSKHDYSDVSFPQAMENCTTCHQGGEDSDNWKTHMSREACTSCHDRTSFVNPAPPGFVLHTAGAISDDSLCAGCHEEGRPHIGPYEVDVTRVHQPVTQFPLRETAGPNIGAIISEAPAVTGAIVSVTGVGSGQTPVVTFTVSVNGAPYDILAATDDQVRFTFAGPTADYAGYFQYTAQGSGASGSTMATATAGQFTWTAPQTIENIAAGVGAASGGYAFPLTGTMAVGMEGRIARPATRPDGTAIASVNYAMHNQVFYVALTDATAVARREATTVENCNTCHDDLVAHGGTRNDPEYCALCHNANRDTIGRQPAPPLSTLARTTSLRLSHMIHRIHTGENLESPYVAYGNSGSPIDFREVRFPGDRRNCEHCHVSEQYDLPLADELLPSRTSDIDNAKARLADYYTGATAAACTGCHDAESAAVHAATMSLVTPGAAPGDPPAGIAESCASCHASGRSYGLDVVHARLGL